MARIEIEVGIVKRRVHHLNWGRVVGRHESGLGGTVPLPVGQRCVQEGW